MGERSGAVRERMWPRELRRATGMVTRRMARKASRSRVREVVAEGRRVAAGGEVGSVKMARFEGRRESRGEEREGRGIVGVGQHWDGDGGGGGGGGVDGDGGGVSAETLRQTAEAEEQSCG